MAESVVGGDGVSGFSSSFSSSVFGSSFSKSPNSVIKVRSGTETDGSIVLDWKN